MKPALIATVIVAAAGIAIVQHFKLSDLKTETVKLEAVKTPSAVKRADRSLPATEAKREATAAQIEFVRESMVEALVAFQKGTASRDPEPMKKLLLAVIDFSGKDIARLLALLRDDPRLAGIDANDACREIFTETAPFAWRDYLEAHRDLPDWQRLFDSAVSNCLRADGKRALASIERETAKGNPDLASSGIRTSVLLELAASDPDKMLALAVSPEFTADPDALFKAGGFTAGTLKILPDHQRFLAALRRAQAKNPTPALAEIRKDYVSDMANKFYQWPAADAISLIQAEFTPDERFLAAEQSASRSDLPEPDKWMDWFLKIDPAEWSAWVSLGKNRPSHPVVRQIQSRAIGDPQTAGTWLAKIPPGELLDEATLNYAWTIADRDPERATGYLDKLPDSKGKKNLVKKIGGAKR